LATNLIFHGATQESYLQRACRIRIDPVAGV